MSNATNVFECGDVTVGHITEIERQGWHALGDNAPQRRRRSAGECAPPKVGMTSLLGTLHVELGRSGNRATSRGHLHQGSLIPLSSAGSYPTTEQTLGSLSLLLNGGGIGAAAGHHQGLRDGVHWASRAAPQFHHPARYFRRQTARPRPPISSRRTPASTVWSDRSPHRNPYWTTRYTPSRMRSPNSTGQRDNLIEAIDKFGKFSAVAADVTHQTRDSLVANLRNIAPRARNRLPMPDQI